MDNTEALSRSHCRERRLNKSKRIQYKSIVTMAVVSGIRSIE